MVQGFSSNFGAFPAASAARASPGMQVQSRSARVDARLIGILHDEEAKLSPGLRSRGKSRDPSSLGEIPPGERRGGLRRARGWRDADAAAAAPRVLPLPPAGPP